MHGENPMGGSMSERLILANVMRAMFRFDRVSNRVMLRA